MQLNSALNLLKAQDMCSISGKKVLLYSRAVIAMNELMNKKILIVDDEKALLKGLKSAAGYLRHELGSRVDLRYTPELQFFIDDSIAYGAHILDMLNHVKPANPANADIVLPEDRE